MRGGVSRFDEGGAQPLTAFARLAAESFASTLMIAGAHPGPGGKMVCTWKALHLDADLGHDDLRQPSLDPRNSLQPLEHLLVGGQSLGNFVADAGNRLL